MSRSLQKSAPGFAGELLDLTTTDNVYPWKACWKQHDGIAINTEYLYTSVYCNVFSQYPCLRTSPQKFVLFSDCFQLKCYI